MNEIVPHRTDERHPREIVVLGGAFNPPTVGHVAMIEAVSTMYGHLPLYVMPSAERTDKPELTDDAHRMNMLALAAEERGWAENVVVSDFELMLPRPSQTYATVLALKAAGVEKVHFVSGVDSINSIHSWDNGSELLQEVDWLIIQREGHHLSVEPSSFEWLNLSVPGSVSSTAVRERLKEGLPVDDLVVPAVALYIKEHNLYKE